MAKLSQADRRDIETLQRLLRAVNAFLAWLVEDSAFVPRDMQGPFREVLPLVRRRVSATVTRLGNVEDTDGQIWRRLDDAGLIGTPLRLKVVIWERTAARVSAPEVVVPTGFVGRALRPLLKLINSILGSLTRAFPVLELVKEYKDGVEVVVEDRRRGTRPPPHILNLR